MEILAGVLVGSAVMQWIFIAVLMLERRAPATEGQPRPYPNVFRRLAATPERRKPVAVSEAAEWKREQEEGRK